MCIEIGTIIETSYNTGPYIVKTAIGPCTCASFLSLLNDVNPKPSKEHYHFVLIDADGQSESKSYLNGYAKEGNKIKSVWSDDEIFIIGKIQPKENEQLTLF